MKTKAQTRKELMQLFEYFDQQDRINRQVQVSFYICESQRLKYQFAEIERARLNTQKNHLEKWGKF